jgi:hypothetical protein
VGRVPQIASFADLGLDKAEVITGLGVAVPTQALIIGTRCGNIKRVRTEDLAVGSGWDIIIGLDTRKGGDGVLFSAIDDD